MIDDLDAVSFTDFSDDDSTNTLTINGVTASISLDISNFSVLYNGIECLVVPNAFNGILTCNYPYKIAGTCKPDIYYNNLGFALTNSAD